MTVRNDLNGLRIKKPGDPKVYLIDRGRRRHIPDRATYDSLFRGWGGIIEDINLPGITPGPAIPKGAVLVKSAKKPQVYLVDGKTKRHVSTRGRMDKYHFRWPAGSKKQIPQIILDALPTGPKI